MTAGLSTAEEFIALFNNLKTAAGTPERMLSFYPESKAVRDACDGLREFLSKTGLDNVLLRGRKGKVVVSRRAGFETAWREYIEKWRFRLSYPTGVNFDYVVASGSILTLGPRA